LALDEKRFPHEPPALYWVGEGHIKPITSSGRHWWPTEDELARLKVIEETLAVPFGPIHMSSAIGAILESFKSARSREAHAVFYRQTLAEFDATVDAILAAWYDDDTASIAADLRRRSDAEYLRQDAARRADKIWKALKASI